MLRRAIPGDFAANESIEMGWRHQGQAVCSALMDSYQLVEQDQPLRQALTRAVGEVQAEEGSILLLAENGHGLRFVVCHSPVAEKLRGVVTPLAEGVSGLAFSLQQPMVVNNAQQDPSFSRKIDQATGSDTRSILAVPLVTSGAEFGVVTAINSKRAGGFSAEDLTAFVELARLLTQRLTALNIRLESQNDGTFI